MRIAYELKQRVRWLKGRRSLKESGATFEHARRILLFATGHPPKAEAIVTMTKPTVTIKTPIRSGLPE